MTPASISKRIVKRILRRLGYFIVPVEVISTHVPASAPCATGPADLPAIPVRMTMEGAFMNMRKVMFVPDFVIDVGAAYGDFTRMCMNFFPDARSLMLEPLEEYGRHLDRVVHEYPHVTYVSAAAATEPGTRIINVHPDLVGSSLLLEPEEKTDVNGIPREVSVTTIDREMERFETKGPLLFKADVQGAELQVLAGAEQTLARCDAVILETTLFNTFENGPLLQEVIAYMVARDFCVYDITGNLYRPLDGALMQVDVIFVKRDSVFRRSHAYATAEQRKAQTEQMRERAMT